MDLYPVCIRRETSPNPKRTPHVNRPSNLYKEGQGSLKRERQQETILGLDITGRAGLW